MFEPLTPSARISTDSAQTFKARAAVIADQAHNPRGALGEGADFMRGLDENERQREDNDLMRVPPTKTDRDF